MADQNAPFAGLSLEEFERTVLPYITRLRKREEDLKSAVTTLGLDLETVTAVFYDAAECDELDPQDYIDDRGLRTDYVLWAVQRLAERE